MLTHVDTDLLRRIGEMAVPTVLVAGDMILDRYVTGRVERLSPEAPIQVLRHEETYENPGGMAAVARNLARLGADVLVCGVIGDDDEGRRLLRALDDAKVDTAGVVAEPGRPTTLKTRFVASGHHARQQILRVDRETAAAPAPAVGDRLLGNLRTALAGADVLVLSDYGKGVLHAAFCRQAIEAARHAGVPVLVDPKGRDFGRYRGATAITPNRGEASLATGLPVASYGDAEAAARALLEALDLQVVFVTLDRDGIFVLERGGAASAIHTEPREVFDVTGAGDNVIAVLAYAMGGGTSPLTAAMLANVAGGIAVERFGAVSVGWEEIEARIAAGSSAESKLVSADALERILRGARAAKKRIVFTNGCFDVLHPGHVDLLSRARAFGDLLVVGLNDDASVRRLKGDGRPVNDLRARATVLGALAAVDYVVAFAEDTPAEILRRVRPDVLVKGEDWQDKGVVGREFVESYGGRVELVPLVPGHSTTRILEWGAGAPAPDP
jgi:D-beta-D-heptose 7-phosphate kinase/D-beta-D-heptose 1-phosphate adenosyltransferase